MSQGYELLVVEVDRIVNSPYPTQLKVGTSTTTIDCLRVRILTFDSNCILLLAKIARMPMYWCGRRRELVRFMRWREI